MKTHEEVLSLIYGSLTAHNDDQPTFKCSYCFVVFDVVVVVVYLVHLLLPFLEFHLIHLHTSTLLRLTSTYQKGRKRRKISVKILSL